MANIIHRRKELIVPVTAGHSGFAGYFKMVARKPDGRTRVVHDWQRNLITNAGLDNIGYGDMGGYTGHEYRWWYWCSVGTGSTPEQFTDTALDTFLAQVGNNGSPSYTQGVQATTEPFYRWQRNNYTFAQGETAGLLTEVGVGFKNGYGALTTRALLRDTNGDPVAVAIAADEQLTVYYEMRCYFPNITPVVGTMNISGIDYDTINLPCQVDETNNMNGSFNLGAGFRSIYACKGTTPWPNIGDHFGEPYDSMQNMTGIQSTYTGGNHYKDSHIVAPYTDIHWGPKGVTGVRMISNFGSWQQSFVQNLNPTWGIPKDNTNELILWFRHSWDRYTPP